MNRLLRVVISFSIFSGTFIYGQSSLNTTLIGRWPYGPCSASFEMSNYAYIGSGGVLEILNISNPTAPVSVGEWITPGVVGSIFVTGNYAYVADGVDGLRIIDVSTPGNPQEVGFFDTGDQALEVYLSGSYAYVSDWNDGLRISL